LSTSRNVWSGAGSPVKSAGSRIDRRPDFDFGPYLGIAEKRKVPRVRLCGQSGDAADLFAVAPRVRGDDTRSAMISAV
jgi:hypothetical protein